MAGEEIRALKRAVGAVTDVELATKLGIERSTVAQWKRRGGVPRKYSHLIGLSDEFPGEKNLNAVRHHLLGRAENQYLLKAALALLPIIAQEYPQRGDYALGVNRERAVISLMSLAQICSEHYLHKPCPEDAEEAASLVLKMWRHERPQIEALTGSLGLPLEGSR